MKKKLLTTVFALSFSCMFHALGSTDASSTIKSEAIEKTLEATQLPHVLGAIITGYLDEWIFSRFLPENQELQRSNEFSHAKETSLILKSRNSRNSPAGYRKHKYQIMQQWECAQIIDTYQNILYSFKELDLIFAEAIKDTAKPRAVKEIYAYGFSDDSKVAWFSMLIGTQRFMQNDPLEDYVFVILDIENKTLCCLKNNGSFIKKVTFIPGNRYLIAEFSKDGSMFVFNRDTRHTQYLKSHVSPVDSIDYAVSANGLYIACASKNVCAIYESTNPGQSHTQKNVVQKPNPFIENLISVRHAIAKADAGEVKNRQIIILTEKLNKEFGCLAQLPQATKLGTSVFNAWAQAKSEFERLSQILSLCVEIEKIGDTALFLETLFELEQFVLKYGNITDKTMKLTITMRINKLRKKIGEQANFVWK